MGNARQQLIARSVTKGIVHVFELIDIEDAEIARSVTLQQGYVEWDEIAGKYINKKSRVS